MGRRAGAHRRPRRQARPGAWYYCWYQVSRRLHWVPSRAGCLLRAGSPYRVGDVCQDVSCCSPRSRPAALRAAPRLRCSPRSALPGLLPKQYPGWAPRRPQPWLLSAQYLGCSPRCPLRSRLARPLDSLSGVCAALLVRRGLAWGNSSGWDRFGYWTKPSPRPFDRGPSPELELRLCFGAPAALRAASWLGAPAALRAAPSAPAALRAGP